MRTNLIPTWILGFVALLSPFSSDAIEPTNHRQSTRAVVKAEVTVRMPDGSNKSVSLTPGMTALDAIVPVIPLRALSSAKVTHQRGTTRTILSVKTLKKDRSKGPRLESGDIVDLAVGEF